MKLSQQNDLFLDINKYHTDLNVETCILLKEVSNNYIKNYKMRKNSRNLHENMVMQSKLATTKSFSKASEEEVKKNWYELMSSTIYH